MIDTGTAGALTLIQRRLLVRHGVTFDPPPRHSWPGAQSLMTFGGLRVVANPALKPFELLLHRPGSYDFMVVNLLKRPCTDDMRQMCEDIA